MSAACGTSPNTEGDGSGTGTGAGGSSGNTDGGDASSDGSGANGNGGVNGGGGTTSGTGANGSGASGSGGTVTFFGDNDASFDAAGLDGAFVYNPGPIVEPDACADGTVSADPLPIDMYVMLDHTGSMTDAGDCDWDLVNGPTEDTKWCNAAHALGKYFTSVESTDHRAALQFMTAGPRSAAICPAGGNNPHSDAAVGLTLLPDNETTGELILALDLGAPTPGRGTQIESALNGIADYTLANRAEGRTMIGVLITDGEPSGGGGDNCNDDIDDLALIASNHFDATGIRTFIIGMTGANTSQIETMAVGGGGPEHSNFCLGGSPCHHWSVGDGDPTAFVEALQAIQQSVVGCTFSVPTTDDGIVDLDTAKVQFTPSTGEPAEELVEADSAVACGSNNGYYIDGNGDIALCDTTCNRVGDTSKIDIALTCLPS